MDDDCIAAPDALAALLAARHAGDDSTALLAPVARDVQGRLLPINRGAIRPRWLFAPLVAAPAEQQAPGVETEIEFCSFVGPLLRTEAARTIGLPMREMFIRFEDVEYLGRLRARGLRMWLVGSAEIVHEDPNPVAGADIRAMWGDYSERIPFASQWKRLYGFRNLIYTARRGGYMSAGQALAQFAVQAVRTLLFHERRARTLLLLAAYGLDGWRGRFRNVPPERWQLLAESRRPLRFVEREALRYDPPARATRPA
jgi:GT2 family glycosyltransferase